jgi:hypothetical protein
MGNALASANGAHRLRAGAAGLVSRVAPPRRQSVNVRFSSREKRDAKRREERAYNWRAGPGTGPGRCCSGRRVPVRAARQLGWPVEALRRDEMKNY